MIEVTELRDDKLSIEVLEDYRISAGRHQLVEMDGPINAWVRREVKRIVPVPRGWVIEWVDFNGSSFYPTWCVRNLTKNGQVIR